MDRCPPASIFHRRRCVWTDGSALPRSMKHKRKSREDDEGSSIPPPNAKKQKPNFSEEEGQQQKPKSDKNNRTKRDKDMKNKQKVNSVESDVEEHGRDSYLPGQIHDTPDQRDPFRIFLGTLHQRLHEDGLAASWEQSVLKDKRGKVKVSHQSAPRLWMMEWGLLSYDDAKKVYEKKLDKNLPGKLESADGDAEDVKTSTFSDRNLDAASGIVSKTKRKKVRRNRLGDAISDLSPRKKFNKQILGGLRKNKKQKVSS